MRPVDTEVTIEQLIERARRDLALSSAAVHRYREQLRDRPPPTVEGVNLVQRRLNACHEETRRLARLIDALVEAERGHCWGHHLTFLREEAELARREADEAATSFEWADTRTKREAEKVGYLLGRARTLTNLADSLEPAHGE